MIDEKRYSMLLKKYLDNTIISEELNELFKLSRDKNSEKILEDMIVHDLRTNQPDDNLNMSLETSDEIYRNILATDKNISRIFSAINRKTVIQIFSVAAVILAIVFGAVFFYDTTSSEGKPASLTSTNTINRIKKVNLSLLPVELFLEDGSQVKLSPNSSLIYPEHFPNEKREVYLTGEAVFEVAKNPAKPFLVFYNNIVTKVLGTSFKIKTNPTNQNAEVSVMTGKVQVFANDNPASGNYTTENAKNVILMPNQKATYNVSLHDFNTTLADSIRVLVHHIAIGDSSENTLPDESFLFEKATRVELIFSRLQRMYGIEIIVDNEHINNCVFTGDVSRQEMLEKLKIICLTIGATFEIRGTEIWVSGKGCN